MDEIEMVREALDGAARAIAPAEAELETFGAVLAAACVSAGGAAGEGPLAGALEQLGKDVKSLSEARGAECRELAQALGKTLDEFSRNDEAGAEQIAAPSFGGTRG